MKRFTSNLIKVLLICLATFTATSAFGYNELNKESLKDITFVSYFSSFCGFVLFVPFVIEGLKSFFPKRSSTFNLFFSWAIGLSISLVCHVWGIGIFDQFTLSQSLASGFGATLACNGIFDSGLVTYVTGLLFKGREGK